MEAEAKGEQVPEVGGASAMGTEAEETKTTQDSQGPPKALLHPAILDRVFSFLGAKDLLTARRVCMLWNERILDNFEKRLALRVEGTWQTPRGPQYDQLVRAQLTSVDKRMLRSLRITQEEGNCSLPDDVEFYVMEAAFNYFRSLPQGERDSLRALDLTCYDLYFRKNFIPAANEDLFRNLRELKIEGVITFFEHHIFYLIDEQYTLQAGKLPNLRSLTFKTRPANKKPMPTVDTFGVLMAAAPNLVSLRTSGIFRLVGMNQLTELCIQDTVCSGESTRNGISRMIQEAQGNLKSLTLQNLNFWPRFPTLQNLKELTIIALPAALCEENRNLTSFFPSLKSLRLGTLGAPEEAIRHLCNVWIPEARGLSRLVLTGFPVTGRDPRPEAVLNSVLNLNLRIPCSLTLELESKVKISLLLSLLSSNAVRIEERGGEAHGQGQRVLEFRNGNGAAAMRGGNSKEKEADIRKFAMVMEKLGKRWDLMRFKGFVIPKSYADRMMTSVQGGCVELFHTLEANANK